MRSFEVLFENNLAYGELRKHYGQYVDHLVKKIINKEPLEVEVGARKEHGKTVILNNESDSAIKQLKMAYYGGLDPIPKDQLHTLPNGMMKAANEKAVKKLQFKTTTGKLITPGQITKSVDFTTVSKPFNTGHITEGILGAAVTAKFLARGKQISNDHILFVLANLQDIDESGKNVTGKYKGKAENDTIHLKISLNSISFKALLKAANSPNDIHPQMLGILKSAVLYANADKGVEEANNIIISDKGPNEVIVLSDGTVDQKGTKADLFLKIDNILVNLLSLKGGNVKQFGQRSGYTYDVYKMFFEETFGVVIPESYIDEFKSTARENYPIVKKVYATVATQIADELAGNTPQEATFVERLYKGIRNHATYNVADPEVDMVILKDTPNKPGFTRLRFGQELKDAMEQFDLQVTHQEDPPVIKIYGVAIGAEAKRTGDKDMLIKMRSNLKTESAKGYLRNVIEMGDLLKDIADVERILSNTVDTKLPHPQQEQLPGDNPEKPELTTN